MPLTPDGLDLCSQRVSVQKTEEKEKHTGSSWKLIMSNVASRNLPLALLSREDVFVKKKKNAPKKQRLPKGLQGLGLVL